MDIQLCLTQPADLDMYPVTRIQPFSLDHTTEHDELARLEPGQTML